MQIQPNGEQKLTNGQELSSAVNRIESAVMLSANSIQTTKITISQQTSHSFFFNQSSFLSSLFIIMTNPTAQLSSILAQCIAEEEQAPSFTFPNYISESESPVFRVSLDVTTEDDEHLDQCHDHLSATLATSQWNEKHLFP